jgi:hypothetical protein
MRTEKKLGAIMTGKLDEDFQHSTCLIGNVALASCGMMTRDNIPHCAVDANQR